MTMNKEERRSLRQELNEEFSQVQYYSMNLRGLELKRSKLEEIAYSADKETISKKVDISLKYTNLMEEIRRSNEAKKKAVKRVSEIIDILIADTPEPLWAEINDYYITKYINPLHSL